MFGFVFTDAGPVRSFAQVAAADTERFKAFFHGMLDEGVYLAPSAFEAGFVSAAHGDEEISTDARRRPQGPRQPLERKRCVRCGWQRASRARYAISRWDRFAQDSVVFLPDQWAGFRQSEMSPSWHRRSACRATRRASEVFEYAGQDACHLLVLRRQWQVRLILENLNIADVQTVVLPGRRNQSKSFFTDRGDTEQSVAALVPVGDARQRAHMMRCRRPGLLPSRISNTPNGESSCMQ